MRITTIELVRFLRDRRSWWLLPVLTCFLLLDSLITLGAWIRGRVARLGDLPNARRSPKPEHRWRIRETRWSPSVARDLSVYTKGDA